MKICIGVYIILWILTIYITYLHAKLKWIEEELEKVISENGYKTLNS